MSVDAIIIGSGPGGATVADVLTSAGKSVVIMEKGRNHLLCGKDLTTPASDYSNDEVKFIHRRFLGPDPFLEPRTFRRNDADGDRIFVGEVNSVPATVGGGGTHADGKVPRFLEADFKMHSSFGPQPAAEIADWPLSYGDLEPFYAFVENRIGVAGDGTANPFAAPRSGPYPMPPGPDMYASQITTSSAQRLGYHPYRAPTAANSVPYDGRPACNNCGFCAYFGCPIHAKGDPIALLRNAMATGLCQLQSETFVSRINSTARGRNRRATGVSYIGPDGVSRSMDAKTVVVACGAIETPRLLLLSDLGGDLLGRHLMVHFQTIAVGFFGERLYGERGRSVTHVQDDAIIGDAQSRAAAKEAGLPWMRGGMVEHAVPHLPIVEAKLYHWGKQHPKQMQASTFREHLACLVMQGEDLPYLENRVDLDPTVRDVRGFPVARVTYEGKRHEKVASRHFGPRLAEILVEAGAQWTTTTTSPGASMSGEASAIPESRHVMGTTRMGEDQRTSVVDPFGRLHFCENVIVADSSVFVTATGYGPTLTLVALAARAGKALVS